MPQFKKEKSLLKSDPSVYKPLYSLPYLAPIHSSALTACSTVQVKSDVLNRITELGRLESEKLSKRAWPIKGGHSLAKVQNLPKKDDLENVLLTGHEDGSGRGSNIHEISF